jgi:hypothetical protein
MALVDKVLREIYIWSWIARVEEECYLEARTQIFVVDYLLNELSLNPQAVKSLSAGEPWYFGFISTVIL